VTEREIYGVRVSIRMGRRFDRSSPKLLARMMQRSRLDAYLAEQAAAAGADSDRRGWRERPDVEDARPRAVVGTRGRVRGELSGDSCPDGRLVAIHRL